jgi:hypothetical protein
MKIRRHPNRQFIGHTLRYFSLGSLPVFGLIGIYMLISLPAHADTFISQSYTSTDSLPLDSIVSLQNNASDQVVAANSQNSDNTLGIVVNADNSSLSLSTSASNQVQVATSGTLQVFVSDINGSIASGDFITASPISGVGMKATGNARVVGIAQSPLNNSDGSKQSYTDKAGQKESVLLGEVPVLVNVSYFYKQPDKTIIPSAVQNIADALAGKNVSAAPVLISAGIFIVTLMVVVSIIYSMIRSSIISVGRNPMSQSAIYRDLIQLSALVLVILVGAFVAIYLVLTKL